MLKHSRVHGVSFCKGLMQKNDCALLCASQREHGEISNNGLTMVPRGYVRANLLKKDPASEQLIPSDKSTKLIFQLLTKNIQPALCAFHITIT